MHFHNQIIENSLLWYDDDRSLKIHLHIDCFMQLQCMFKTSSRRISETLQSFIRNVLHAIS
jgi:hypothetical protein